MPVARGGIRRSTGFVTQSSSGPRGRRCPTARSAPARCERGRGVVPAGPAPPPRRSRIRCHAKLPPRAGIGVAGSRPYRRGDAMRGIDWAASARLSAARSEDAFIVRERFADESPGVVVISDRRPAMALCPPDLPWLEQVRHDADGGTPDRVELRAAAGVRSARSTSVTASGEPGLARGPSGLWQFEERAEQGDRSRGGRTGSNARSRVPRHRCEGRSRRAASSSSSPTSSPMRTRLPGSRRSGTAGTSSRS